MLALVYFICFICVLESFVIGSILYNSKNPKFELEVDESNPDDVKFKLTASDDINPGHTYFIKVTRK